MLGDQGGDDLHDGPWVSAIDLELFANPSNCTTERVGCWRMKADFIIMEFDGGNFRTGLEPVLPDVVDGDFHSTGVKAELAAGIHDQRAVSREGAAHQCFASARLRGVEDAYTANQIRVALTGILLSRQLWRALAFGHFIGGPFGHLMFQVAYS